MRKRPTLLLFVLSFFVVSGAKVFGQRVIAGSVGSQKVGIDQHVPSITDSISVASWTPLAELAASQNENAQQFGQSVSVSGNVAVVGSWGDAGQTGAAYVFVKSSGPAKAKQRAKLTASDGEARNGFGYSVAISGNTIVVGALGVSGAPGKIYVFVEPAGGWTDMTEAARLTASDGQPNDEIGMSVSISGNTIVAGAPFHTVGSNANQGSAYVFVQPAGGWANMTQTAELTASDGTASSLLGYSVAISGDTVVAGEDNNSGNAAYVFVEPAGGWVNGTETAKLTDPKDAGVGFSVAISGNTIVAGSPSGGPHGAGVAHVYVRQGNSWKSTSNNATLRPSEANNGEQFGYAVATTGGTVLAGAPSELGAGVVYAFAKPTTGWTSMTQTQELTPSDGKLAGRYGTSVSASGPAVLIGASGTNTAYVYTFAANAGFTAFSVPGSTSTGANGVNNQGQIVGSYSKNSNCPGCGFLYANGTFTTIAYPGATSTAANGINDVGEVAGSYYDALGISHGFTEINGAYNSLDYPGAAETFLYDVDNLGDVVGNYYDSDGHGQGFFYSDGVFTPINVPGSQSTALFGINNNGVTAGNYCITPCSEIDGFVDNDGIFTTIDYPGAPFTGLAGIDDNGDLVGGWGTNTPGRGGAFAFWSQTHRFVNFSLGGPDDTSANGINLSGEIVGSFCPNHTSPCYGFYGHLPGH